MKHQGIVLSVDNGGNAIVSIQRDDACKQCGACKIGNEKYNFKVKAINSLGARSGQTVEIELGNENMLTASIIVYLIPLVALFLGVFIGNRIGGELLSALTGILFLVLTFFTIHIFDKRISKNRYFKPLITQICIDGDEYDGYHTDR